jgi:periodic tryptophan protein 1
MVVNFDARTLPSDLDQPSPARFTIAAHDGAACALDVNTHIRGCLATAGTDKMVKIWNVQEYEDGAKRQVSLVAGRDLGLVSATCGACGGVITVSPRARSSRLSGPRTIL